MDAGASAGISAKSATGKKALIVCTSARYLGDHRTGVWSEEATGPYFVFKDAGLDVTICSIGGCCAPIDMASLSEDFKTANDQRAEDEGLLLSGAAGERLSGSTYLSLLETRGVPKLMDHNPTDYAIVYFSGGHGACMDFCTEEVGGFVSKAHALGTVVACVWHGSMALVHAKTEGGDPLVNGKSVSVFSDKEEEMVNLTEKVPFLLEAKMKELGAAVELGDPWTKQAVRDGNLVTGQNPQSSVEVAKLALACKVVTVNASVES
eukprot:TRINITY_DN54514_c0_g1_i1.p1 TRINITY_DN54514_c0_g1~~TRINITY_DN54514_c0_g1_i1.p1  ORF type:complete len:264 (+),score=47.59 TRINITY_DN54514_c0_g1_i1:71-862(+)